MKELGSFVAIFLKIGGIASVLLFTTGLTIWITFLMVSPGRIEPFRGENALALKGSVAEKIMVEINGVRQGMIIKGENINNPVLLFLHGGPGMPEYFLTDYYETGLEKHFTVCYWEQRGAGLSYSSELDPATVTVKQLLADTAAVANYLRERFGKEKVYLLGHSWGTFLGIQAAAERPELYHAYIGIAQIKHKVKSERLAYDYMLEQYRSSGNSKMENRLKKFDIYNSESDFKAYSSSGIRDKAMHELGVGTMRTMNSVVKGIFLDFMRCRAYTAGEKINLWRAKAFLSRATTLSAEMSAVNLGEKVKRIEVPVYFLAGIYDYTVNYSLSKEYFQELEAPVKAFYTFNESAHSPLFEEPGKFISIMLDDVMKVEIGQADKQ